MHAPRTRRAAAALLAGAVAALGAVPAASARTEPELRARTAIGAVRAWETPSGRLAVDVRVRHGTISRRAVAVGHRHRLAHEGRVRLSFRGGRAARTSYLHLTGRGRSFAAIHRVRLGPAASRRALAALRGERLRITIRAEDRILAGGRLASRSRARAVRTVAPRRVRALPRLPRPRCESFRHSAPYGVRSTVAVVCMGDRVDIRARRKPRRLRMRLVRHRRGRAVFSFRPAPGFTGADSLTIEASSPGGSTTPTIPIVVPTFKLRALGDSVTAGFGYLGTGAPMQRNDFFNCIPPTQLNDRCSSNSSNGPESTATTPGYTADFGLGNGVSWAAQFAQEFGITSAMYENRAVSGATPEDWNTGQLNGQLETIVADSPNLTVMTLGANPLLDTFITGGGVSCDQITEQTPFRDCVLGFVNQVDLKDRLKGVWTQLLQPPSNVVVVSQYHLATPSIALAEGWAPWQLEALFSIVNGQIRDAAQELTDYGERLFLIAPPHFNLGLPGGSVTCPGQAFTVDGPSRQAQVSQQQLQHQPQFCPSNEYWIISADLGIHPTTDGYAQFAGALADLARAHDLVPPLP